jgi:hypothetical protein
VFLKGTDTQQSINEQIICENWTELEYLRTGMLYFFRWIFKRTSISTVTFLQMNTSTLRIAWNTDGNKPNTKQRK